MSFTLRLFVMGLVALAPDQGKGELTLILQNDKHHTPILICDPEARGCDSVAGDQGCCIGDRINQEDGKSNLIHGYILAGDEISIAGVRDGVLRFDDEKWDPSWFHKFSGVVPKERAKAVDVSWVPAMGDILPSAGTLHEDVLLKPAARKVSGLLILSGVQGDVKVFHLAEECGYVPSLTFSRGGRGFKFRSVKQALADVMVVEIPIKEDKVVFSLTPFGAGSPRRMELAPKHGERVVNALLANLSRLCVGRVQGAGVEHFSHFYALSSEVPPLEDRLSPRIGFRKVKAGKVNPGELPLILEIVSGNQYVLNEEETYDDCFGRIRAGLSRPMCTFGEFALP